MSTDLPVLYPLDLGDSIDYSGPLNKEIKGVRLVRTCYACPQQYDAFIGQTQVAYLRLRHGRFTVESPDVGGALVYSGYPKGDGIFAADEEEFFLNEAVDSILAYLAKLTPSRL